MEKLPYKVIIDELPEQSVAQFSGQLIINHIEKITAIVKQELKTDKDLKVEIVNTESIDVTFIQLLLSIKDTFKSNGHKVNINAELNEDLQILIKNAGFQYVLN